MSNYETFRDRTINHQDMREQIDKQGVFHTSTVNKVYISFEDSSLILLNLYSDISGRNSIVDSSVLLCNIRIKDSMI